MNLKETIISELVYELSLRGVDCKAEWVRYMIDRKLITIKAAKRYLIAVTFPNFLARTGGRVRDAIYQSADHYQVSDATVKRFIYDKETKIGGLKRLSF